MTNMARCYSPIDGTLFTERPYLDQQRAETAIEQAHKAQQHWAAMPLEKRIEIVSDGIAVLGKMNDEIVPELAWQMGRPIRYQGEFSGVKERADYLVDIAIQALSPTYIDQNTNSRRFIERAPVGVVLVIAPWNYPFLTAINTIIPALIAGNAVVLKHASQTLLVGERLEKAMHLAGVPVAVMQNLVLDHHTCSNLISQKAFGYVNFTGSVATGVTLGQVTATSCTPIGLELGGKDPGYVAQDANLEQAVSGLIDAAMFNSGQCCCGIERIYVAKSRCNEFVEQAQALVEKYVLGNPLDQSTTLGPMAQLQTAQNVRKQTVDAIAQGARTHIDNKLFDDDGGNYLMPQLLTKVNHSMHIMREESFGPVVGIMATQSDEQAIALMNDSDYGLTASIWTTDADRATAIGRRITTGTVFMNRADYVDPALCWGGCKRTGRGGSLGTFGYSNLTRAQSFHLNMN